MHVDFNNPNGHVTMNSFGLTRSTQNESKLDELYRTLGVVRPVIAEMLTRRAYLKDYGILDENSDADPLAICTYQPKLDVVEGGPNRSWIRRYYNSGIKDSFNLSLTEFFECDYSNVLFLLELAESNNPMKGLDLSKDFK